MKQKQTFDQFLITNKLSSTLKVDGKIISSLNEDGSFTIIYDYDTISKLKKLLRYQLKMLNHFKEPTESK